MVQPGAFAPYSFQQQPSFFLILTQGYVYWFEREGKGEGGERKRERERERERERSIASRMLPNQGWNPQPRYVPWLGIESVTFWCTRQLSNQLNCLARAEALLIIGKSSSFKIFFFLHFKSFLKLRCKMLWVRCVKCICYELVAWWILQDKQLCEPHI